MRKPSFTVEGRGRIESVTLRVPPGEELAGFELLRRALPAIEALDRIMRDSGGDTAVGKQPAEAVGA